MNDEMSNTNEEKLWDEKNSIEPSKNNESLPMNAECDITTNINVLKDSEHLNDTTAEKTQIEKRREYCRIYHQKHQQKIKEQRRQKFIQSQQLKFDKIKLKNPNPPHRNCPSCGTILYYTNAGNRNRSEKSKALCNSCKFYGTQNPSYKKIPHNKGIFLRTEEERRQIAREASLLRNFGITQKEYDTLLISQNGKCKICGISQSNITHPLCVDHCHSTNKIRGLLCKKCNTALGLFNDNLETIKNAITYLQ